MSISQSVHLAISKRYANAYYEVFLLTLVVVWLPFKLLAYLVPFICMGWFILRANSGKSLMRLIWLTVTFLLINTVYVLVYYLAGEMFIVQNSILFILTYGSFLFFLILPANGHLYITPHIRYINVIRIFIIAESCLGIFQVCMFIIMYGGNLDAATGDIVQGTLDPLSFINMGGNFNNQIYTSNLLLLLLFYTPHAIARRKGIWICVLGFVAVLLASVWHLFLAFIAAVIIVSIYYSRSVIKLTSTRLLVILLLVFFMGITMALQPKNFELVGYYYEKMTSFESPKAIATIESINDLPKDFSWVYYIGLGPGQYASRAGLMGTGKYFGDFSAPKKLPLLHAKSSKAFQKYIYPKWEEFSLNPLKYGNSTMSRPFYSILSLLVELGPIIFGLLGIWGIIRLNNFKRLYKRALAKKNLFVIFYSLACGVLMGFLVLISFFENYLEVAHAIFAGLLLFRYFFSLIKNEGASLNKNAH